MGNVNARFKRHVLDNFPLVIPLCVRCESQDREIRRDRTIWYGKKQERTMRSAKCGEMGDKRGERSYVIVVRSNVHPGVNNTKI